MQSVLRARRWTVTVTVAACSLGLVVWSWAAETAVPQTSVLVWAAGVAGACLLVMLGTPPGPGWVQWRRAVVALAAVLAGYAGIWAAAVLASGVLPWSSAAWLLAALALVAHLPVLAGFSLLPLMAVRYLGQPSSLVLAAGVGALGVAAALSFAAFFDDYPAPLRADALITSSGGEQLGVWLMAAFVASVLVGPVRACWAAWRTDGAAARRLALVAASSLAGVALVTLCGALATMAGATDTLAVVFLLVSMDVAVVLLAGGCSHALTVRIQEHDPWPVSATVPPAEEADTDAHAALPPAASLSVLTRREVEVLTLLGEGLSNAGIAARLVVSERTVDAHLRSVFAKLRLPDGQAENRRVHAAAVAWRSIHGPSDAAG